jgi:hypothetical protein
MQVTRRAFRTNLAAPTNDHRGPWFNARHRASGFEPRLIRPMMDKIDQLIAKDEIMELSVEYAECLDANEPDRLTDVFTDDCIVEYFGADDEILRGLSEVVALLRRAHLPLVATCHLLGNFRVEFLDDRNARGSVYVRAWHRSTDGEEFERLGRYDDEYVRATSGWRISRRVLHTFARIPAVESDRHIPAHRRREAP